jgi:hypothetical protein
MQDDGSAKDIEIPALIVDKEDAKNLKSLGG